VEFTTETWPGETFTGTVAFIHPILDETTRTVKVRVNVPNPDSRLKPGMFVRAVVRADIAAKKDPPLVIPASAPLLTGTRAVVYVVLNDKDKPTFEGRTVVLGPRAGEWYVVRSGLNEGERVVTRGAFKIDAELQIRAKPSMMANLETAQPSSMLHKTESQSSGGTASVTISAKLKPQTHCPVMGGKINKKIYTDHKGYRIYFCCPGCLEPFLKEPEKFITRMQNDGIELEKVPHEH
jgi:Cu(I)/Ag(I) efflux system membrane fusion protein